MSCRRHELSSAPMPANFLAKTRTALVVASALVVALATWVFVPRQADLRAFDPIRMAQAETALWRDYYDKRYFALFQGLYLVNRDEFGFSPFDSFRLSLLAANAARKFQPTTSREEAGRALPDLQNYYAVLAQGAHHSVNSELSARLELDWWQARRENVAPEIYGETIAKAASELYGVNADRLAPSGVLRAKAMQYRDQHGDHMTDADWAAVDDLLRAAYLALQEQVAQPKSG
jgi:hypothetical protein